MMVTENNENKPVERKGGKLLLGAAIGGVIGSISALLFAPKKGSEMRKDISDKYQSVNDKTKKLASDVSQKTQDIAADASEKTQNLANSVKTQTSEIVDKAKDKKENVMNFVKSVKKDAEEELLEKDIKAKLKKSNG
jgi:gas vesicle protein